MHDSLAGPGKKSFGRSCGWVQAEKAEASASTIEKGSYGEAIKPFFPFRRIVLLIFLMSSNPVVTVVDGYASIGDAKDGPLTPGKIGIVEEDDKSSLPFKVQSDY